MVFIQGDFLVHFMDIARDELTKKLDEISVEKLQVQSSFFIKFLSWQIFLSAFSIQNDGDVLTFVG